MRSTAIIAAATMLLTLGACENGEFAYSQNIKDFKSVTGYGPDIAKEETPAPAPAVPGPPLIVGFDAIRVALPFAGESGEARTYVSPDGVTIAMNSGFVTHAVGLGHDMHGSYLKNDSPWFGSLARAARERKTTNRVIEYWEKRDIRRDKFHCVLSIAERAGGGSTVDETCRRSAKDPGFVNRYWLDAQDRIECSRQWVHPKLSPLQFFSTEQQALTLDLTETDC